MALSKTHCVSFWCQHFSLPPGFWGKSNTLLLWVRARWWWLWVSDQWGRPTMPSCAWQHKVLKALQWNARRLLLIGRGIFCAADDFVFVSSRLLSHNVKVCERNTGRGEKKETIKILPPALCHFSVWLFHKWRKRNISGRVSINHIIANIEITNINTLNGNTHAFFDFLFSLLTGNQRLQSRRQIASFSTFWTLVLFKCLFSQ